MNKMKTGFLSQLKTIFAPTKYKIILYIYTGCMLSAAIILAFRGMLLTIPVWQLQDSRYILRWVMELLLGCTGSTAAFIPAGLLFSLAFANREKMPSFPYRLKFFWLCLLGTLLFALLFMFIAMGLHRPTMLYLFFPWLGCLLGTLIGMNRVRKKKSLIRLLLLTILIMLLLFISPMIIAWFSLEKQPLNFEPGTFSTKDKQYLVALFKGKDPRTIEPGQMLTAEFTEEDVNKLLAWGLAIGSGGRKARVEFTDNRFTLRVSIKLPVIRSLVRYLNLELAGVIDYRKPVWVSIFKLKLGGITLPRIIYAPAYLSLYDTITNDINIKQALNVIRDFQLAEKTFTVTYGHLEVPEDFASRIMGRIGTESGLAEPIYAQIEALKAMSVGSAEKSISFASCLQTAFALAAKRSQSGNALTENKAAIYALAILIGHDRIGKLVGPVTITDFPPAARRKFYQVQIKKRSDWTKHFLVSAALELLSNDITSDAIGLLKEELDSGQKGSGFSFADFLADRAGTTFAGMATKNNAAARRLQQRITGSFEIDDYFPEAADLPEKIYEAELQSKYGGVGGELYNQVIAEIEKRVAACAAYRE